MGYLNAFVHPFHTISNYYIYDANTDSILTVNKNIYQYFSQKDESALSNDDLALLNRFERQGFLKSSQITKIEHPMTPLIPDILSRKVASICLQVTQQCNLRCSYCIYSGNYFTRGHSSQKMTIETAKKGIDFLIKNSIDLNEVNVSFYGGEPLLMFHLIRDIVSYALEEAAGKKINFYITTNGTIFNDEIIEFLEKHQFSVLISLDGPKEVHDKSRVFAASGEGTFDFIMKNLSYVKKTAPNLYKRLMFNAVIDPSRDVNCSNEFFVQLELEDLKKSTNYSTLNPSYVKNATEIPDSFYINSEVDKFKAYLAAIRRYPVDKLQPLSFTMLGQLYTPFVEHRRRTSEIPQATHPGGPCIPGARRLFCNVSGNFYPCERVSESSQITCIGNLEQGFNYERVVNLLNPARLTEEQCKKCWAIRFCTHCFAVCDDLEKLSKKMKQAECANTKMACSQSLVDYTILREFGCDFGQKEQPVFAPYGGEHEKNHHGISF